MQSHVYNYTPRQALGILMPTMAVCFGCIVILHLADWAGWPPLRLDDGGIRNQIKMANSPHPAQIVFVGDSTCWCGIDALQLSNELPGHVPAINLSVFIWFNLNKYAQQAADFTRSNPHQVKWVVLLVCGPKLCGNQERYDENIVWNSFKEEPHYHSFLGEDDFLSGSLLGERWAQRIIPETLHGRGASFLGFNSELSKFMAAHNGSIFDFGEYVPIRNQKKIDPWHLEPAFEPACQAFRGKIAPDVKLAIGLTPAVLGTMTPGSQAHYQACLEQWGRWIHADLVLSNLPPTLPTFCFAPGGHLNALGQKMFTSAVAKEISPVLR